MVRKMKQVNLVILFIALLFCAVLHIQAAGHSVTNVIGDYFFGDGTGVNCYLQLTSKNKFNFKWEGCLGTYDKNNGDFTVSNGILTLIPRRPNIQKGFQGTPTIFFVVSWDDRLYLIATNKIIDFCCNVNDQSEPRKARYGRYYLREKDWEKSVKGGPRVPSEWTKFLLASPVRGTITQVVGKQEAWIDAGSENGLIEGMVLTAQDHGKIMFSQVRVESVQKNNSRIKCEWADSELEVGQKVSSLFIDRKP